MHIALRFANMYTLWNVVLLAIWVAFPNIPMVFKELIQANTFIVAVSVLFFWVTGTNWESYKALYESFNLQKTRFEKLKTWLRPYSVPAMTIIDVCIHFLPVAIVGIPQRFAPVMVCYTGMVFWFAMVRTRLEQIYVPSKVPIYNDYGVVILLWTPLMCILMLPIFNNSQK